MGLLTIKQVAEQLGVKNSAVRAAIKRCHLRAVQLGRGDSPYLMSQKDVDAWLDSRTVENKARRAW